MLLYSLPLLMLLCAPGSHALQDLQVSISLFSLFKPEAVQMRLANGEKARLEVDGYEYQTVSTGETIRVRLIRDKLEIAVEDSSGRARRAVAGVARVFPYGTTNLELSLPGKIDRVFRGEIVLSPGVGDLRGQLQIVLKTNRESVIASVVAAELSGQRAVEAFNALAVVVRSFLSTRRARHGDSGFDFCDTTHCQLYRGEQDLHSASGLTAQAAAARTRSQLLTFEGRVIDSYYTATCGGLTMTPEMAWGGTHNGYPHRRVRCHWCRGGRNYRWIRSAETSAVFAAVAYHLGERFSASTAVSVQYSDSSDRVRSVVFKDGDTRRVIGVETFRRAIGLKLGWNTVLSSSFRIERHGSRLVFRGRGFGSQVGLCLAGAVAQARAGRSYGDILNLYFPGRTVNDGRD